MEIGKPINNYIYEQIYNSTFDKTWKLVNISLWSNTIVLLSNQIRKLICGSLCKTIRDLSLKQLNKGQI